MKRRIVGLDILRILSMILITVIHYVGYSDIISLVDVQTSPINYGFLVAVKGLSRAAVNIFVLITGYFMCTKEFKITRILKLWCEVELYSLIVMIFASVFVDGSLQLSTLIKSFFPLLSLHYWFFVVYVLLCLISPGLNIIIKNINKNIHLSIVIIMGILITIYMQANPFASSQIYIGHSHSIVWFSYLYLLGAYIHEDKSEPGRLFWTVTGIVSWICLCIVIVYEEKIPSQIELLDNNTIFSLLLSLSVFMLFKDIKINSDKLSITISKLSACSFGVYLIQEHQAFRNFFWNCINAQAYANSPLMFFNFLISVICLWPISIIIHKLFEFLYHHITTKKQQ